MMNRTDFITIIKKRSVWKIDKRKGNYSLPNGKTLRDYVTSLVESQLELDQLVILKNGSMCEGSYGTWDTESKSFTDFVAYIPFKENEVCSYDEQQKRIKNLVNEII